MTKKKDNKKENTPIDKNYEKHNSIYFYRFQISSINHEYTVSGLMEMTVPDVELNLKIILEELEKAKEFEINKLNSIVNASVPFILDDVVILSFNKIIDERK